VVAWLRVVKASVTSLEQKIPDAACSRKIALGGEGFGYFIAAGLAVLACGEIVNPVSAKVGIG
jgi:hypothetical protein